MLVLGCGAPAVQAVALPELVTASAVLQDGSRVSVVAILRSPNHPPELRFRMGLFAVQGDTVIQPGSPDPADRGPWQDLFTGAPHPAPAPPVAQVRPGPGLGFRLEQVGSRVLLTLPSQPEPVVLLRRVDHAVSLGLLTDAEVGPEVLRHLRTEFKSVRAVAVQPGVATVDGALDEWRDAPSLSIAHAAQVVAGEGQRQGDRDSSLVVAARFHASGLTVAVRLIDDHLTANDRLTFRVGNGGVWVVRPGGEGCPEGIPCALGGGVGGRAVELTLPVSGMLPGDDVLPLLVRYTDHDPGQPPVTLANAPNLRALTVPGLRSCTGQGSRPHPEDPPC